jgi:hypothetical protein
MYEEMISMKNEKAIYKYTHDSEVGFMHYVVFDGEVVVLSKVESKKVGFIKENGFIEVTADIKGSDYGRVNCKVVFDQEYVKKVYNYMIETNNAYFTDGTEDLCALVFEK